MKKIALLALISSAALFACSGDDNNTNDGGPEGGQDVNTQDVVKTDSGSDAGDGGPPGPPTLKTQVDRIGRPAINTALNHTFDTDGGAAGAAKDTYNADKNVAGWQTAYGPELAKNLGILDGLDTVCGNQAGYTISNSYAALAGLAADDRVYLKTDATACTAGYLAVELAATNILPNTDCGGRKLTYDVIDVTYSAAAIGAPAGVSDGINATDAPVVARTNGTTFPYLAVPH
jgi:hypothetical protein